MKAVREEIKRTQSQSIEPRYPIEKGVHRLPHEPIASPGLPLNNFRENETYHDDDLDEDRAQPENVSADELAKEFYP